MWSHPNVAEYAPLRVGQPTSLNAGADKSVRATRYGVISKTKPWLSVPPTEAVP